MNSPGRAVPCYLWAGRVAKVLARAISSVQVQRPYYRQAQTLFVSSEISGMFSQTKVLRVYDFLPSTCFAA